MLPKFFKPLVSVKLIRAGSSSDGGYFVPKKVIFKIKNIISCGLGLDWSFEKNFQNINKNLRITVYDHTVNYIFLLKDLFQTLIFCLRYRKNYISIFKIFDYFLFFRKKNVDHKKLKICKNIKLKNETNLNIILKNLEHVLLKIDIEGDEYKILDDIISKQKKIFCLIIEFHTIHKNKIIIKKFIKKLKYLKNCNISPNNSSGFDKNLDPYTVEMIFINKFFLKKKDYKKKINIKALSNNPYKKNFPIKFKNV